MAEGRSMSYEEMVGGSAPSSEPRSMSYEELTGGSAKPGALARSSDEGWLSGAAKGAATGVLKGVANIPGAIGNIRALGDVASGYILGEKPEELRRKREARSLLPHWMSPDIAPTGAEFAAPVLEKSGEYKPESTVGKIGQAAVEGAVSALGPGSMAKLRGVGVMPATAETVKQAPLNALSSAAAEGVYDTTHHGGLAFLAGLAAPGAAEVATNVARNVTRPMRRSQHEAMAGEHLEGMMHDPAAVRETLWPAKGPTQDFVLKGSQPTLGQLTGDVGLLSAERGAMKETPAFSLNEANRNTTRLNALRGIEAGADTGEVAKTVRNYHNSLENNLTALEAQLAKDAQLKAEKLGPAANPEVIGADLRNAIEAKRNEVKAQVRKLYNAVDPDGKMTVVGEPISKAARLTIRNIDPLAAPLTGDALRVFNQAAAVPEVVPFKSLIELDKNVTDAMRGERRANGESNSWRLLSKLKGDVQGAIDNAVANQSAWENVAVEKGILSPDDTLKNRLRVAAGKPPVEGVGDAGRDAGKGVVGIGPGTGAGTDLYAPTDRDIRAGERGLGNDAGAAPVSGNVTSSHVQGDLSNSPVWYPGGNLRVKYEVVDLPDLVTSHDTNFRERGDYPQHLQPRDRSSKPAQDQVNNLSSRLVPERLGPSHEANTGAPIVGPDNVVESGNGRTLAVAKNYEKGNNDYRRWLESQGYDTAGMKAPILVGRRISPMSESEREFFAHSANAATGLRMNAVEQAGNDAKFLTPDVMSRLTDAPITGTENKDFLTAFLDKMPVNERGAMIDANGNLSQNGVKRLQAAVASRAYDDADFIGRAFESADSNIRNISGALVDSSGPWARMRQLAREGVIDRDHDITPEVMKAVKAVMRARDEGRPIAEVLAQSDMFQSPLAKDAESLLFNGDKVASKEQIAARLKKYAEEASKNEAVPRLFGETVTPRDIIGTAAKAKAGPAPVPEGPSFETGAKEARQTGPRPSFDEAAADRYGAAKKAHAEFAKTYKSEPIAGAIKTTGFSGQYATPSSAIPGKAFTSGDKGYQTASAFLKAAKDAPEAVTAMQEAALNALRKTAVKDGVLSPDKLAKWKADHAPALRALDEKVPGFSKGFDDAAKATDKLTEFAARSKQLRDDFEKSAFGKFIGVKEPDEIQNAIGKMLTAPKGAVANIRQMVKGMPPEAVEGMRKSAADWIGRTMSNVAESIGGEEKRLSYAKIDALLKNNGAALAELFTPEQMNTLRALRRDMELSDRTVQAARSPTNPSGTAKDVQGSLQALSKQIKDTSIWMAMLGAVRDAYREGGVFGAAAVGVPAASWAGLTHFRGIGAKEIHGLVVDALQNPAVARQLLMKIPPKQVKNRFDVLSSSVRRGLLSSMQNDEMMERPQRIRRASGGRAMAPKPQTAQSLLAAVKRARKAIQDQTEAILAQPDETVVRALSAVKEKI